MELTLQRGLCYSLYVLISDGQGSRAFSGVLRPMEDGTLMIGGEEILYEPEEEKPRTRSAGLMPVVYESEPNSNYGNADIIRPDECMKGYLATFYDTDCLREGIRSSWRCLREWITISASTTSRTTGWRRA